MAAYGMKLTWSPKSNVALYGATTDIPAALAAGVLVSLAPTRISAIASRREISCS